MFNNTIKQWTISYIGENTPKTWHKWMTAGEVLAITKEYNERWRKAYNQTWKIESKDFDLEDMLGRFDNGYRSAFSVATIELLRVISKDKKSIINGENKEYENEQN